MVGHCVRVSGVCVGWIWVLRDWMAGDGYLSCVCLVDGTFFCSLLPLSPKSRVAAFALHTAKEVQSAQACQRVNTVELRDGRPAQNIALQPYSRI